MPEMLPGAQVVAAKFMRRLAGRALARIADNVLSEVKHLPIHHWIVDGGAHARAVCAIQSTGMAPECREKVIIVSRHLHTTTVKMPANDLSCVIVQYFRPVTRFRASSTCVRGNLSVRRRDLYAPTTSGGVIATGFGKNRRVLLSIIYGAPQA